MNGVYIKKYKDKLLTLRVAVGFTTVHLYLHEMNVESRVTLL